MMQGLAPQSRPRRYEGRPTELAPAAAKAVHDAVERAPAGRKLVVLVHGYTGSQVIDGARKRAKSEAELREAFYGDYAALAKVFQRYLAESGRSDVDFLTFKYDTFAHQNAESARVLNRALQGRVATDSKFPASIGKHNALPAGTSAADYSQVFIVTLSNGNQVAREAVLQAQGIAKPAGAKLEADPELQALYARAAIYDVSPILAGAADARGALDMWPIGRHSEIDPFGSHQEWLFSEQNIDAYDRAIQGRHHTFFAVGDRDTRGIWDYWCDTKPGAMDPLNRIGSFVKGNAWKASHREWFARFERARGADREHHTEFVTGFPGDSYCGTEEYLRGNELLRNGSERRELYRRYADSPATLARFGQRRDLPKDHFLEMMSPEPSDYFTEELIRMHAGDSYGEEVRKGFYNEDGTPKRADEARLLERHNVLVFYKPLLGRIGRDVFGASFAPWFESAYRSRTMPVP